MVQRSSSLKPLNPLYQIKKLKITMAMEPASPGGLAQRFLDSCAASPSPSHRRKSGSKTYGSYLASFAANKDLQQERIREREQVLSEKTDRLARLWVRAKVPEAEQSAFLAGGGDLPYAAKIARVKAAIDHCLQSLVTLQRTKLLALWDALKMGEQERGSFQAFKVSGADVTEQTLLAYDDEISRLQERLAGRQTLLDKIETFDGLLRERDALTVSTADPRRLLDRNTNSFRWRKAEERLQALLTQVLPESHRALVADVAEWEASTGTTLIIRDEPFLDWLSSSALGASPDASLIEPLMSAASPAACSVGADGSSADGSLSTTAANAGASPGSKPRRESPQTQEVIRIQYEGGARAHQGADAQDPSGELHGERTPDSLDARGLDVAHDDAGGRGALSHTGVSVNSTRVSPGQGCVKGEGPGESAWADTPSPAPRPQPASLAATPSLLRPADNAAGACVSKFCSEAPQNARAHQHTHTHTHAHTCIETYVIYIYIYTSVYIYIH